MSDAPTTPLTLDDWKFSGTPLAVLGHPIRHSLSPPMHNAALGALAIDDARFANWRYFRFDVPPDDLPTALKRLHRLGFLGVNLTVPHKVLAVGQVEEIDPDARPVGAVNTLLRTATGWRGFNTDGYGLETAVRETLHHRLAGTPVILLGAGGAARGAAVECLAQGCASLAIANRSAGRRDALLEALKPLAGPTSLCGFDPAEPPKDLPPGALVINATSLGLKPGDPAPLLLDRLPRPRSVYDMVYNPPQTALLRQAESLALPHANGLSMLAHQGAKSLEIWTGQPAERTAPAMIDALRNSTP